MEKSRFQIELKNRRSLQEDVVVLNLDFLSIILFLAECWLLEIQMGSARVVSIELLWLFPWTMIWDFAVPRWTFEHWEAGETILYRLVLLHRLYKSLPLDSRTQQQNGAIDSPYGVLFRG